MERAAAPHEAAQLTRCGRLQDALQNEGGKGHAWVGRLTDAPRQPGGISVGNGSAGGIASGAKATAFNRDLAGNPIKRLVTRRLLDATIPRHSLIVDSDTIVHRSLGISSQCVVRIIVVRHPLRRRLKRRRTLRSFGSVGRQDGERQQSGQDQCRLPGREPTGISSVVSKSPLLFRDTKRPSG